MTFPTYASTSLPDQPLSGTWTKPQPYLEPAQTDFDGGNKRLRRQPGDEVMQIQFDILYTNAQFATFETFVKTTLGGGISRFTMRVRTGGVMELKTVQFSKAYQPSEVPPSRTQVTFLLWVYP
jgi:hypothetical protein